MRAIESMQGNPQYIKFINKKHVLHYIKENQGCSRSEISQALSISKPTSSKAVDALLEEGWVTETESDIASFVGGRKPLALYFNSNAKFIVGVDIGGTAVELALINLDGDIIASNSFPTQLYLPDHLIGTLTDYIYQLMQDYHIGEAEVLGVGVGVPGITNVEKGVVIDAPSLEWEQYPLQDNLQNALPFPVYIDNDVNVAALGEHWKGAGQGRKNVLHITLGTGIGCGIIINDQLYRGSTFAAGEIGYMITDKNAAQKKYYSAFAGYGFLDSHVGGPSIVEKMRENLSNEEKTEEKWTAKRVFESAMNGDKTALKVINEAISHLAFTLINIIALINPECVVLGGGISKSVQYFLPTIRETIENHVPTHTEVTVTKHENASLLGAANLLLNEYDSILQT